MEITELVNYLQKIEIRCKTRSGQKLNGMFQSFHKGRGITPDAIRKYESRDDIRDINWNVTARFQDTYVNTFIEDKERRIWLLIDISRSGIFGTGPKNKFALSIEIGIILAYSAIEGRNSVGIIFFNEGMVRVIPPSGGKAHFWSIAREMVAMKPSGEGTDIGNAIRYLMNITNKQSSVFIISDFICDSYTSLAPVLALQHELTAICVSDPCDHTFPEMSWLKLKDAEHHNTHWVNSSSAEFQSAYHNQGQNFIRNFKTFFNRNNSRSLCISTGDDLMERLTSLMEDR